MLRLQKLKLGPRLQQCSSKQHQRYRRRNSCNRKASDRSDFENILSYTKEHIYSKTKVLKEALDRNDIELEMQA